MALGTLFFRGAQWFPYPHPCLSGSLHIGHYSWHHVTLASWPWLKGMKINAIWGQCGLSEGWYESWANKVSLWGNDRLSPTRFFSLHV